MSTYLSLRRRYSEPEKPEPKFQWRLRVHSLMMDESTSKSSPQSELDRSGSSFDNGYHSLGLRTRNNGEQQVKTTEETKDSGEDSVSNHQTRRNRFMRTKSDGHLKLRVRFSKLSDSSQSFEDKQEADESRSLSAKRKLRTSVESGFDSFGEHHTDEDEELALISGSRSIEEREGGKEPDDGFIGDEDITGASGKSIEISFPVSDDLKEVNSGYRDNEDETGASEPNAKISMREDENVTEMDKFFTGNAGAACQSPEVTRNGAVLDVLEQGVQENTKDISKGAIPKILPRGNKLHLHAGNHLPEGSSCWSTSGRSYNFDDDHEARECKRMDTTESKKDLTEYKPETDNCVTQKQAASFLESNKGVNSTCDSMSNTLELNETDNTTLSSKQSTEDLGNVDDIEAIIERIIAEEEAILKGGRSRSPQTESAMSLNDQEIFSLKGELKEMINEGMHYKADNEKGIDIIDRNNFDKQRSASLPSHPRETDGTLSDAIMPLSSSLPSFKAEPKRDQDAEEAEEEETELEGWAYMPVILLEDVFTLLTPKERHQASMVCRQWYNLFYSPRVWETFILLERTLTKKRFNLYKGYQRELCPGKTQLCFRRVGSFFKRIVVTPIADYFNLYEFLRILAAFLQYQEDHGLAAMPLLHTFDFTFACASRGDGGVIVHGTGGQILDMIKQLLVRISNLRNLTLNQLLVDETDVPGLFDAMTQCFSDCLHSLEMLNVTKVPHSLPELANFRSLVKLTVSPQHVNEEVLILLAGLNLSQLHLVQDPYTCPCEPVSAEAWKLVREIAPWLRVYLEVAGNTRAHLLIQPRAPVHGVFLRTPYSRLTSDLVMLLVEHYSKTLRYFVQERLPRIHGPRGIDSRCDSSLLFLVRRCPLLQTLVIRERLSTSTLILVANEGKSLTSLLVRRQALIKRCDWPQPGIWSKEFYARLKINSLDYDRCKDEVCALLRRRWRPLTDKQFLRLKIVPKVEVL